MGSQVWFLQRTINAVEQSRPAGQRDRVRGLFILRSVSKATFIVCVCFFLFFYPHIGSILYTYSKTSMVGGGEGGRSWAFVVS